MSKLFEDQKVAPIPASIVQAIAKVMLGMSAVKKSQKNLHGGYMYASADDIYAAISLKMAESGLISLCLEETSPEIHKVSKTGKDGIEVTKQWMKVTYTFVLATETDTWTDTRSRRSLFLEVTGAQTFQAAQSYAEKSWLRSLFKIATGDMDLDGLPQSDEESGEDGPRRQKTRAKAQTVQQAPNGTSKPLPPIVGQYGEPH